MSDSAAMPCGDFSGNIASLIPVTCRVAVTLAKICITCLNCQKQAHLPAERIAWLINELTLKLQSSAFESSQIFMVEWPWNRRFFRQPINYPFLKRLFFIKQVS